MENTKTQIFTELRILNSRLEKIDKKERKGKSQKKHNPVTSTSL
jgi:hypothetical protein